MESRAINSRRLPHLRHALLRWYDQSQRDLPWRKGRDPYRVWVSEIMLQQTRVAAVLPRYEKFMRRFPSVEKLASARLASVLAEWSGLGYYRRARNLHAAAKVIARGVDFPESAEAWRKLPGVGRYTAAAIASIAFNQPVAVLDGNVSRVLRRLLAASQDSSNLRGRDARAPMSREGDPHGPGMAPMGSYGSSSQSWAAAQQLLDPGRPGDFNQAMMELGATICLPGEPLCGECPIRIYCSTRGRGESRSRKPRQIKAAVFYALATKGDSVLLVQRGAGESLMSGMWELPVLSHAGSGEVLLRLRHSITVTDYVVSVVAQPGASTENGEWISRRRALKLPLTGLTKKILRKADII